MFVRDKRRGSFLRGGSLSRSTFRMMLQMLEGVKTMYTSDRFRSATCRAYRRSSSSWRDAPVFVPVRPSPFKAGNAVLTMIAMIAITTNNSNNVKALTPSRRTWPSAWPSVVFRWGSFCMSFTALTSLAKPYCQLKMLSAFTSAFALASALAKPSGPSDQTITALLD